MTLEILLYSDIHLSYDGPVHPYEQPSIEEQGVDVVLSVGDLIKNNIDRAGSRETGRKYEERGRAFFEYLNDEHDVPVVAIPGNHDPVTCTDRLVDGLESVVNGHRRVVGPGAFPRLSPSFDGIEFVGWGAEQFDLDHVSPELSYDEFPALVPAPNATPPTVEQLTEDILSAVGRYVADELSPEETAASLEIAPENRPAFYDSLDRIEASYSELRDLIVSAEGFPVLCTHQSPFGVSFDHHHSGNWGTRVHTGSIAIRLAIAATDPLAVFSGHTHRYGHDSVTTVTGETEVFNGGEDAVFSIEMDPRGVPIAPVRLHPDP